MLRLFWATGVFLLIEGLGLSAALIIQAITGWGSWLYFVLGGLAAGPAIIFFILLMKVQTSNNTTSFSDRLGFTIACVFLSLFILPAGCSWSRSHTLEQHGFDTWLSAPGTTHSAEVPWVDYKFTIENTRFNGQVRTNHTFKDNSPITVWYNPRDPQWNVINPDGGNSFPITVHPSIYFLVTGGAIAVGLLLIALSMIWPLTQGWWLPIAVAIPIAGAALGGYALGQSRAASATKHLFTEQNPAAPQKTPDKTPAIEGPEAS